MKYKNLNLGCGMLEFPDCLNVDIRKTPIVHQVWDLEQMPWPFEDEQFAKVYAYDIIEHLTDVIKAMEEIHRILKSRGWVIIRTTSWKTEQSFRDPTHKHFFTLESFDYFDRSTQVGKDYGFYSEKKFKILHRYEDGQELMFEMRKI